MIFTDENKTCTIDCRKALWAADDIHDTYMTVLPHAEHRLSDVDWVIETDGFLILVEYKNSMIPGAKKPAYDPAAPSKFPTFARKYYDSLHYLRVLGKNKPTKYICILEYPSGDYATRARFCDLLCNELPFGLHTALGVKQPLLNEVRVFSIDEWNSSEEFGKYPIQLLQPDT